MSLEEYVKLGTARRSSALSVGGVSEQPEVQPVLQVSMQGVVEDRAEQQSASVDLDAYMLSRKRGGDGGGGSVSSSTALLAGSSGQSVDWLLMSLLSVQLCLEVCLSFYNKIALELWDFPLSASLIQLACVSALLLWPSVTFLAGRGAAGSVGADRQRVMGVADGAEQEESWFSVSMSVSVNDSRFHRAASGYTDEREEEGGQESRSGCWQAMRVAYWCQWRLKLRAMVWPSLWLAVSMSLNNLGISLASVSVHALLKCSKIVFVLVLSAWCVPERHQPSALACLAAMLTGLGTVLYSYSTLVSGSLQWTPLLINLCAALTGAFYIVSLKKATDLLLTPPVLALPTGSFLDAADDGESDSDDVGDGRLAGIGTGTPGRRVMMRSALAGTPSSLSALSSSPSVSPLQPSTTPNQNISAYLRGEPLMSVSQAAVLKMSLSAVLMLPAVLALDGSRSWRHLSRGYGASCNVVVLSVGVLITGAFQSNAVALSSAVTPVLFALLQQCSPVLTYLLSLSLSDVLVPICSCHRKDKGAGHPRHCHSDNVKWPVCPCFEHPVASFNSSTSGILHSLSVVLILSGVLFFAYLRAKGLHTRALPSLVNAF